MQDVRKVMLEENPPGDLVIVSHLFTHLVDQVAENGPMRELWMFVFESYFGVLKTAVKNRRTPVASIMKSLEYRLMIDMVKGLQQRHLHGPPSVPIPVNDPRRYVSVWSIQTV